MPLLGRVSSSFTSNHREIHGLYYLGKLSLPLNIAGLLYLTFAIITFNFPSAYPVSSDNVSQAALATLAIIIPSQFGLLKMCFR